MPLHPLHHRSTLSSPAGKSPGWDTARRVRPGRKASFAGMWHWRIAVGLVALATLWPSDGSAASPAAAVSMRAGASTVTLGLTASVTGPAPVAPATTHGLAVVAFPGAADAAWPLAQAVYADRSLRPDGLDDARARVLCGDAPPPGAAAPLRDIAQTVAALRRDDAPTRILLGELARQVPVRGLIAVWMDASGRPIARIFLPESNGFDAAIYTPDEGPSVSWSGAARSLARIFAPAPPGAAPALATHEAPTSDREGRGSPFYQSPWFWGGIGAAAAAAAAIYLATRDSGSPTIHLEVQVPR